MIWIAILAAVSLIGTLIVSILATVLLPVLLVWGRLVGVLLLVRPISRLPLNESGLLHCRTVALLDRAGLHHRHRTHVAICHHRTRSRDDRRATTVLVVELVTILGGLALHLQLRVHRRIAWSTHRNQLRWARTNLDAPASAVIRNAVALPIAIKVGSVIDVRDAAGVDAVE